LENTSPKQYLALFDKFLDFYNSSSKRNNVHNFWPVARIQSCYFLFLYSDNKIDVTVLKNKLKFDKLRIKISDLLNLFKTAIKFLISRQKCINALKGKVLLVGFAEHYYNQNNEKVNLYLSPIKYELKNKNILFEELLLNNDPSLPKEPLLNGLHKLTYNYANLTFKFKNIFNKFNKKAYTNALCLKEFLSDNDVLYSNHISNIVYKTQIENEIYFKAFIHLLKITKPKAIWTYCYYDNTVMALIRAANKLGIKNIEYQHSVQSDEHFAYAKWPNIDYNKMHFPNIFWVWSKSDADRIVKNFSGITYKPTVVVGGNLAVIQEKNKGLKSELGAETGILVSLQGLWIPDFVEKIIEKDILHKWHFRLHPRYPQDKQRLIDFKNKFPDKVEIDLANNLSLFSLFTKVKANIADFSGVALEAEQFGIKNIIVNDKGASVFQEKIKSGDYLYVNSEVGLEKVLQDYDFDLYRKSQPTNDKKELEELINKVFLS